VGLLAFFRRDWVRIISGFFTSGFFTSGFFTSLRHRRIRTADERLT
jgi:hypothetical protein